jgi:hypothetical protein
MGLPFSHLKDLLLIVLSAKVAKTLAKNLIFKDKSSNKNVRRVLAPYRVADKRLVKKFHLAVAND